MRHMTGFPLIDIHQHVIPDVYRSALARIGIMGSGENSWPQWSMARTLELMDENRIAGVMTSIASPGAYFGDVEFTRSLVRDCNEALPHMGGVTPFLLFRLSGLDAEPKLRARFPDGVAAHLRRLHYDVAQSAAPLSFRALLEIADPSRILFGTDYPFARNAERVLKDTIE